MLTVVRERGGHRYEARIAKIGHRWTVRIIHIHETRYGVWRTDPGLTERRDARRWTRRSAERYANREVERRLEQSVKIDELLGRSSGTETSQGFRRRTRRVPNLGESNPARQGVGQSARRSDGIESRAVQEAFDSPGSFIAPDVMASWGATHVDNERYYVVLDDGTWNLVVLNPAGEIIA